MDWKGEFNNQHLNLKKRQLFVNSLANNEDIFNELDIESQNLETQLDIKPETIVETVVKPNNFKLALNLTLLKIALIILGLIFVTIFLKKIHVI